MNKLRYVMRDFTAYVFSSRLLLFILMQLVIMHFYVKNILSFSEAVNYPVSIWIFPFLFQHVYIQFIYGISSVYFFSTVPFFQYSQLYTVVRQGRTRWMLGKCLRILLASIFLVLIDFLISVVILLPNIEITSDWGKVLYSLAMTDAVVEYNIKIPIPYSLINGYTAGEATMKTLLILFLVTMIIGFIMFVFSMIWSKLASVTLGTIVAVLTIVVANMYRQVNQITYLSPLSWSNLLLIDGTICSVHPEFWEVVCVSVVICIVCVYVLYRKVKLIDFEWIKEE